MSKRIIGVTVGTPISPVGMERKIKPVKTVNGISADEYGNVEINCGGVGAEDAVLYTKQELTEEQKAQARENIGACSADALSSKLDKITTEGIDRVYGVNWQGTQTTYGISIAGTAGTIPLRRDGGALNVGTPTENTHATTKAYVDNLFENVVNEVLEALPKWEGGSY